MVWGFALSGSRGLQYRVLCRAVVGERVAGRVVVGVNRVDCVVYRIGFLSGWSFNAVCFAGQIVAGIVLACYMWSWTTFEFLDVENWWGISLRNAHTRQGVRNGGERIYW